MNYNIPTVALMFQRVKKFRLSDALLPTVLKPALNTYGALTASLRVVLRHHTTSI